MPSFKDSDSGELLCQFQNLQARTERTRALAAIATGGILYALFHFLDRTFYPNYVSTLFWIRLVTVASMGVAVTLVARAKSYWAQLIPSAVAWVAGTGAIGVMCHLTDGFASPYWAGIPLCGIAATFFTWPPSVAVTSFLFGLFPYYAPLFQGSAGVDRRLLILTSAFICATYLLALLGIHIHRKLAFRAFLSRRQLEKSHAKLAELDEAKNRMFQNVSHELRTPLTLMLSPVDRALNEGTSSPLLQRQDLEMLHRNGLRLLKQIDDLLELARLSSQKTSLPREPTDLVGLISRLVADAAGAAEALGIELTTELPTEPIPYSVNPEQIERIVLNLLSNALKFTEPGGVVSASCQRTQDDVRIQVVDDGPGIFGEDLTRVFGRFEQIRQKSTAWRGGAGIGLALVKESAELLGGHVSVYNEPGGGSRFVIVLPKEYLLETHHRVVDTVSDARSSLNRRAQIAALRHPAKAGRIMAGRRGPRVLIAEDDSDLRLHLVDLLRSDYRVIAVPDGEAAYAEALSWQPHLIISDIMMPKLDGIALCTRIREHLELSTTAVIFLTARNSVQDRIAGRKVGVETYLTKPFASAELEAAIVGLLRSRLHIVGDFLLRHPLGSGGQSKVFLAEHLRTGAPAALKLIASRRSRTSRRRQQLRRELTALTLLEHPNIVRIVAGCEQKGDFFLATEYLLGSTVSEILHRKGPFDCGVAAEIGVGLCRALQCVHNAGLIHRDIKCSNVMLLEEGTSTCDRVRLIDFGSVAFPGSHQTQPFGTIPYLAPELVLATGEATFASDLYAVGVMLFKMCTGRFPQVSPSVGQLRRSLRSTEAPRVSALRPDVPPALADAVQVALASDPTDRCVSAAALARRLEAVSTARGTTLTLMEHSKNSLNTPTQSLWLSNSELT